MYQAFRIAELPKFTKAEELHAAANELLAEARDRWDLSPCFKDGKLSGDKLQELWFPQVASDVFISHSQADKKSALRFASWLKFKFDLSVFVDSRVWGQSKLLMEMLKEEFPDTDSQQWQEPIHVLLTTALGTMVNSAECVFFLETPNSLGGAPGDEETKSPWLYYELSLVDFLPRVEPKRLAKTKQLNEREMVKKSDALPMAYKPPLGTPKELTAYNLECWKSSWRSKDIAGILGTTRKFEHALDALYDEAK